MSFMYNNNINNANDEKAIGKIIIVKVWVSA
ncbi:MAG: hypothetical protein MRERV_68c001 [Mycoplasmataceae bacterium RV_VA103A]|nr:MAG: hypothetical protein MRERV_68c001 [Mycoplasmataceae bacterium RV_VA103A]